MYIYIYIYIYKPLLQINPSVSIRKERQLGVGVGPLKVLCGLIIFIGAHRESGPQFSSNPNKASVGEREWKLWRQP